MTNSGESFDEAMRRVQDVFQEMRNVILQLVPGVTTSVWSRVFSDAMHDMREVHGAESHGTVFVTYRPVATDMRTGLKVDMQGHDSDMEPQGIIEVESHEIIDAGGDTEVLIRYTMLKEY